MGGDERGLRVGLKVWPGPVTAGSGTGGGLFTGGGETAAGDRQTVRVGASLHVAVVTATTAGDQPLLPGTRFSYNVRFTPPAGGAKDLHSLGLLADRPQQPALGYQAGLLPSFATCPATIDDLVLLHGSCNRIEAGGGPNLMFAVDELIGDALDDASRRPHQLWLSGDQVYADEVAATMSVGVTALGRADRSRRADGGGDRRRAGGSARAPGQLPRRLSPEADVRRGQAHLGEAASHLLGMTERTAMQLLLWSAEVWDRKEDGTVALPAAADVLPSREPPLLGAVETAKAWLADNLQTFEAEAMRTAVREAGEERELVLAYAAKVGRVRRALANVATYFMFDDHDVTDDWNLCRLWRERVEGNALGRSVVRDGLVSYALTQGWGNDPDAFEGGPGAELLDAVGALFPDAAPIGPDPAAAADLDGILGLGGRPQAMRWSYTVDGAVHRVLACDTRTRRGFTGPVSPPVQLPDGEREAQIPAGPLPAGFKLLIVLLSQPALDPVLLGELTQGLVARGAAAFAVVKDQMSDLDVGERRAITGLETLDYEGWGARPHEIVRLLDRLATYDRVLIMSGDVHFGVSLGLQYWRRGQGLVSTIGQFTSSAVQYITYPEILVPLLGQGWANELLGRGYPFDMLVWDDPPDPPVVAPGLPARGLRRRLRQRPVVLPTRGWPDGTDAVIPPDAAWRLTMIADDRPDEERPEPVRAEPLPGEFDATDPLRGGRGYGALSRRHSAAVRRHNNTRRIAIFNKVARLTFEDDDDGRLAATSELLSIDHHEASAAGPEPFAVHRLLFDADTTTPEPAIES